MNPIFTTTGNVRGNCGHKHITSTGAIRCLQQDQRACRRAGGYSDRALRIKENGEWRNARLADLNAAAARELGATI